MSVLSLRNLLRAPGAASAPAPSAAPYQSRIRLHRPARNWPQIGAVVVIAGDVGLEWRALRRLGLNARKLDGAWILYISARRWDSDEVLRLSVEALQLKHLEPGGDRRAGIERAVAVAARLAELKRTPHNTETKEH